MHLEELEKYKKAGRIVAGIKQDFLKKMCPGDSMLEVAEAIESRIMESGAKPAFPVNISINEVAAHYTPVFGDTKTIGAGDLVKVDLGAQVDGYIADSAFTYCSDQNSLIGIAEGALETVVNALKIGITVAEIGEAIEDFVKSQGVGLIVNLTGHGIGKDDFHGKPTIPNVRNKDNTALREDSVIAIEPFITSSNGFVKESGTCEIFRFVQYRPVRMQEARHMLDFIRETYGPYPFAKRWLAKEFGQLKASMGLRQLEAAGCLESFPVLKEVGKKPIAQAEHTIIIKDKPIVITKLED